MTLALILLAVFLFTPWVWGISNWVKNRDLPAPNESPNYHLAVNSAVLYALAFNLIFMLQEIFLVLGKTALGLTSVLYHNNHTWEGDHPLVQLMQGSGALGIFLIGAVCLLIFRLMPKNKSIWRLLLLWLAFHGLLQSIPQLLFAYLDPGTDVGDALVGYLSLSEPLLVVISIASLIATALLANWFGGELLSFAPGQTDMSNQKARVNYIWFIAAGAAILGSILIVPFRVFPMSQAMAPIMLFIFTMPWVWSASATRERVIASSNRVNEQIYRAPMVFLIVLLAFFRFVLAPGVEF